MQDAHEGHSEKPGQVRGAELGPGEPEESSRCAARPRLTLADFKNAFGARGKVDPIRHLIGTAVGWGGNPDKDATYPNIRQSKNDGKTVYKLNVKNVPVDGFWSVSLYNEAGYFEKNPYNAYSVNNITAKKEADGSVTVQFGGCDGKIPNCIPITKGWNSTLCGSIGRAPKS